MSPLEQLAQEYGYICIISTEIMIEPYTATNKDYPMIAEDGQISDLEKNNSFECAAIHRWLIRHGRRTNPYDRSALSISECKFNLCLQNEIESFIRQNQKLDQVYADNYLAQLQNARNVRKANPNQSQNAELLSSQQQNKLTRQDRNTREGFLPRYAVLSSANVPVREATQYSHQNWQETSSSMRYYNF